MNSSDRLDEFAAVLIPEAIQQIQDLKQHRAAHGKDAEYFRIAKVTLGFVGGASRVCATIENHRTNNMVEQRFQLESRKEAKPAALSAGE